MTATSIISIAEYKTHFPADRYGDELITQGINMAYDLIDAKYCSGVIAEKWDLTEANGGFTELQKTYIKNAFFIQARYMIQTNFNMPQGSIQRTNGSQSINVNVPKRDSVYEQVLYWLQKAGLTTFISGSNMNFFGMGINGLGEYINLSQFLTWNEANKAFLKTQYTAIEGGEEKKYKLPYYNGDCVVAWILPSDIIANGVQLSRTGTSTNNVKYITVNGVEYYIGGSGGEWGSIVGDIQNQTDLQTQFGTKQAKVYYGATAPTDPQDNDIWVQDSFGVSPTQKQSDWNQTDTTAVDYIKNKPTIPTLYCHRITITINDTTRTIRYTVIVHSYLSTRIDATNYTTYYQLIQSGSLSVLGDSYYIENGEYYPLVGCVNSDTAFIASYIKDNAIESSHPILISGNTFTVSDTVSYVI